MRKILLIIWLCISNISIATAAELRLISADNISAPVKLLYPTNFTINTCSYDIRIETDTNLGTTVDTNIVWGTIGTCVGRQHYIKLDGKYYEMDDDIYINFIIGGDLVWIKHEYENCQTISGDNIEDTSNQLVLLGSVVLFSLKPGFNPKMIHYPSKNTWVFVIKSANTDIICDNQIDPSLIVPADIIYANGFD